MPEAAAVKGAVPFCCANSMMWMVASDTVLEKFAWTLLGAAWALILVA